MITVHFENYMKHVNICVVEKKKSVLVEVISTINTVLEGVNTRDIETLNMSCNVFRYTVSLLNYCRSKATLTNIAFL
jgi:indole-3-glycerol phosphate synthase